ncbi:hypothetical protein [Streptomyces ipomoeae]|uniref:hypothetical protein n=1 Tax=Streptomyces ipomoeae TaxID=103232 RepID=UPI0029C03177|nr:hypothetical protein [Streptomyces ipomoeae]
MDDADNLDMEALGLLTVVLRHRDGYEITLPEIAAKYGYARDGLAGAWGLLQVARYVVKVRIQWAGDNQFGTEVVVYDTPASDDEIQDLLASIAQESNVRAVQLVPPTKTAMEKAAKHLAKVEAKRKSKPERRKLDFDVPKQGETGRGRGGTRRGGEDQAGGGASAAAPAKQPARRAAAAKKKEPGKRLSKEQAAAVRLVKEAFPEQLREMLPSYLPPVLRDAILEALDSRKPEVLVDRVQRRWWAHGYEAAAAPGGKGIGSAVGVAIALVRPSTDCPEPMCEDGVILDNGVPCRTCEKRREDRKTDRINGVPAQHGEGPAPGPAGQAPGRWTCRGCRTLARKGTEAPEDGLCRTCRSEAEEAAAATAAAKARLDQEEARRREEAAVRWDALVEEAYAEHAEREWLAAEDRARREAAEERKAREAEERRLLQEQIRREHPELAAYSQTG